MNAVEFVKKFGWGKAKQVVNKLSGSTLVNIEGSCLCVDDLKRLVESYELVESYGGISMAKRQYSCFANASESVGVNQSPRVLELGKAIADVEKCQ